MSCKLLFDKNGTITFNRDLAAIDGIGINGAIMLQQIHYWVEYNKTEYLRGNPKHSNCYQLDKFWTKNKIESWKEENFPFWSTRTIIRIFSNLEENEFILIDNFNEKGYDQTRWYTINYEKLEKIANEIENNIAKREKEKIKKTQEKNRKKLELQIAREKELHSKTIDITHYDNVSTSHRQVDNMVMTSCHNECDNMTITIPKITTKLSTELSTNEVCTTTNEICSSNEEIISLIEKNTHLILTYNMKKKVKTWRLERAAIAIDIFKENEGMHFSLLEKIYKDNRNFIPKKENQHNKNKGKFHSYDQRTYDFEDLEKKLLGWDE